MKPTILIISEDSALVEQAVQSLKRNGYSTFRCKDTSEVLDSLKKVQIDIVLQSLGMPPICNRELYTRILELAPDIPILVMCGHQELKGAIQSIKKGVYDFIITPPWDEAYALKVIAKATDLIQSKQTQISYHNTNQAEVDRNLRELNEMIARSKLSTREMVQHLLTAADYRDDESGNHVKRIGMYSTVLSATLKLDPVYKETLAVASPMHDVGKIGIRDNIVLKAAPLTAAESALLKRHTLIGHNILARSSNAYLQMASTICLGHHENWDGSGYPYALKGEAIPLECRIVKLCDEYDTLRNSHVTKNAMDHQTAVKAILSGFEQTSPTHFDPRLMNLFPRIAPVFEKIFEANNS